MSQLTGSEFNRMWRVLDQSLSAHSLLRDRYDRRQRGVTVLVLTLSIVATAGAFVSAENIIHIGPIAAHRATWLGVLTALIFFVTLVSLVTNWSRQAWMHEDSARRLSELKGQMRAATLEGDRVDEPPGIDLRVLYEETMARITAIPERKFLSMKAKHQRKVAVSKLIDSHRGAPVMYLRLLAILQGMRGGASDASKAKPDESVEAPPV